eukprot:Skav208554  [mRNA]  locus=scaffold1216:664905:667593:+ [translate_table: standard]
MFFVCEFLATGIINDPPKARDDLPRVALKITVGAPVGSQLRLRFKVQTPTDRTTFLQERWHIDVQLVNHSNGMVNLVTTNDGVGR